MFLILFYQNSIMPFIRTGVRRRSHRLNVRRGRTTLSASYGSSFLSGGIGRDGPYALYRKNLDRRTGVKVSVGMRGMEIGADRRITKNTRVGAGYNFTQKRAYGELKYKKRKVRF
jgi:hypothetical protein